MKNAQRLLAAFEASAGVSTDTRSLRPGELFFALSGPNFDGNHYAAAALAAGASAVVVDDPRSATDERAILVDDALAALQVLAKAYRRTLTCPLIALTGSNGKTTTKELLHAILSQSYRASATVGNLNNHIGVPLTLLRIPRSSEVAIVEMGANHVGEIGAYCAVAEPTHGAITNIGRAHLEGFGGVEGVRRGKGELFDYLAANDGYAFADADDGDVYAIGERVRRALAYSSARAGDGLILSCRLREAYPFAAGVLSDGRREVTYASHLPGEHNHRNIALASAIGAYFKVPLAKVAAAIAEYRPANSRSEVRRVGSATVLLDAYNANPDSTLAGLRWLASREEPRKVALLGTLAELGAYAKTAHAEIAAAAHAIRGAEVAFFGAAWEKVEGVETGFTEVEPARAWLAERLRDEGAVILVKGSRSNRLERLLPE